MQGKNEMQAGHDLCAGPSTHQAASIRPLVAYVFLQD